MTQTKPCRYCGHGVARNAQRCPGCDGKRPFPQSRLVAFLITVSLFGLLFASIIAYGEADHPSKLGNGSAERIDSQFSAWDGSHSGLVAAVQESMYAPDSFEHVKTIHRDEGDHLLLQMTFRGKNQMGGVSTKDVQAKADFKGNVLELRDF